MWKSNLVSGSQRIESESSETSSSWFRTLVNGIAQQESDVTLIGRRNTDPAEDENGSPDGPSGMIRIEAHRLVLSAASPYFAAMFSRWTRETELETPIRGVDPQALQHIVKFIYGKERMPMKIDESYSREELVRLIQTADMLQMEEMKDVTLVGGQGTYNEIRMNAYIAVVRQASPWFAKLALKCCTDDEEQWPHGKRGVMTVIGKDPTLWKLVFQFIYDDFLLDAAAAAEALEEKIQTRSDVIRLISMAGALEMDSVKELGCKMLVRHTDSSNVIETLDVINGALGDEADNEHRTQVTRLMFEWLPEVTADYNQNAELPWADIKNFLNNWKTTLELSEEQAYTYAVDHWVLGAVAADGRTDPKRLKRIPDIYGLLDLNRMDRKFLAETVAKRDVPLWDKKDGVCSALVVEAMRRHLVT